MKGCCCRSTGQLFACIKIRNIKKVVIGHDMKRFNEIRDALDLAKIPYKHKVRNQDSEWFFQGKGTKRSQFGSIGVDQDKAYEYEILVRKEDKARAEHEII